MKGGACPPNFSKKLGGLDKIFINSMLVIV